MTIAPAQIRDERYTLTQLETGITTVGDARPGQQLKEFASLWTYQVPVGDSLVFQPGDIFSLYLEYLQDTVDQAQSLVGATYTHEETANNNATANDINLFAVPASETVSDAYYWGQSYPFSRLRINLGTAGVAGVVAWEYYNGTAWVAIPGVVDGTTNFTAAAGTYNVNFAPPSDWAATTVNGARAFYIRARLTTVYTTRPLGTQVWINGNSMPVNNLERIRIWIENPTRTHRRPLLYPYANYNQITEFQDQRLYYRLPLSQPMVAAENEILSIEVRPTGGVIHPATGYWQIKSRRIRKGIFSQAG